MAHESFEDQEIARILNDNFISIKVDREERPDVDSVYMTVCQALTNQGGWPLTIIMTPEQKPFFAGTYFPKDSRYNMLGLKDIFYSIITYWKEDRNKLISTSESILEELNNYYKSESKGSELSFNILDNGYNQLADSFDSKYGGFRAAPKFPTPHKLMFLLRYYQISNNIKAQQIVQKTLDSMYKGGIFDHIGFGFSRYSTDNKWLVPHFEKMLYDNALLVIAYLEGFEVCKNQLYKDIAIKTLEYIFRVYASDSGGFFCAEDADSEGEEGKYYLFSPEQIKNILGEEDGTYFNKYFDITEVGNFEGRNIPNLINNNDYNEQNNRIDEISEKILEYRDSRMKLHKDDKILTSWNGLMIAALAKAYKVIQDERYLEYAKKTVNFIYKNLFDENGRLLVRYRDNESIHKAYLDDYAFLCYGLIELYQSCYDVDYLEKAIKLNKEMISLFWNNEKNGFFLYGDDGEKLIARPKELFDGAIPSGNSVAAYNLIKLARITGDINLESIAEKQLNYFSGALAAEEMNYSFFLIVASFALNSSKELVCLIKDKEDEEQIKDLLSEKPIFNLTTIIINQENKNKIKELIPFIQNYQYQNNKSTFYLCKDKACLVPVNDINSLKGLL